MSLWRRKRPLSLRTRNGMSVCSRRKASSCSFSLTMTWASESPKAASLPGLTAIH